MSQKAIADAQKLAGEAKIFFDTLDGKHKTVKDNDSVMTKQLEEKKSLETLRNQLKGLLGKLDDQNKSLSSTTSQLDKIEADIKALGDEVETDARARLKGEAERLESEKASLMKQQAAEEAKVTSKQAEIDALIAKGFSKPYDTIDVFLTAVESLCDAEAAMPELLTDIKAKVVDIDNKTWDVLGEQRTQAKKAKESAVNIRDVEVDKLKAAIVVQIKKAYDINYALKVIASASDKEIKEIGTSRAASMEKSRLAVEECYFDLLNRNKEMKAHVDKCIAAPKIEDRLYHLNNARKLLDDMKKEYVDEAAKGVANMLTELKAAVAAVEAIWTPTKTPLDAKLKELDAMRKAAADAPAGGCCGGGERGKLEKEANVFENEKVKPLRTPHEPFMKRVHGALGNYTGVYYVDPKPEVKTLGDIPFFDLKSKNGGSSAEVDQMILDAKYRLKRAEADAKQAVKSLQAPAATAERQMPEIVYFADTAKECDDEIDPPSVFAGGGWDRAENKYRETAATASTEATNALAAGKKLLTEATALLVTIEADAATARDNNIEDEERMADALPNCKKLMSKAAEAKTNFDIVDKAYTTSQKAAEAAEPRRELVVAIREIQEKAKAAYDATTKGNPEKKELSVAGATEAAALAKKTVEDAQALLEGDKRARPDDLMKGLGGGFAKSQYEPEAKRLLKQAVKEEKAVAKAAKDAKEEAEKAEKKLTTLTSMNGGDEEAMKLISVAKAEKLADEIAKCCDKSFEEAKSVVEKDGLKDAAVNPANEAMSLMVQEAQDASNEAVERPLRDVTSDLEKSAAKGAKFQASIKKLKKESKDAITDDHVKKCDGLQSAITKASAEAKKESESLTEEAETATRTGTKAEMLTRIWTYLPKATDRVKATKLKTSEATKNVEALKALEKELKQLLEEEKNRRDILIKDGYATMDIANEFAEQAKKAATGAEATGIRIKLWQEKAPCLRPADKDALSAKLQSAHKLPTSFQLEHPVTPINAKVSPADRLTNLEKMSGGELYKEAKQAIMLLGIANAVKPTPQMLLDVDDLEAGTQSAKEKAIASKPKTPSTGKVDYAKIASEVQKAEKAVTTALERIDATKNVSSKACEELARKVEYEKSEFSKRFSAFSKRRDEFFEGETTAKYETLQQLIALMKEENEGLKSQAAVVDTNAKQLNMKDKQLVDASESYANAAKEALNALAWLKASLESRKGEAETKASGFCGCCGGDSGPKKGAEGWFADFKGRKLLESSESAAGDAYVLHEMLVYSIKKAALKDIERREAEENEREEEIKRLAKDCERLVKLTEDAHKFTVASREVIEETCKDKVLKHYEECKLLKTKTPDMEGVKDLAPDERGIILDAVNECEADALKQKTTVLRLFDESTANENKASAHLEKVKANAKKCLKQKLDKSKSSVDRLKEAEKLHAACEMDKDIAEKCATTVEAATDESRICVGKAFEDEERSRAAPREEIHRANVKVRERANEAAKKAQEAREKALKMKSDVETKEKEALEDLLTMLDNAVKETVKEEEQVAACKLNDATEIDRPDAEDEAVPKPKDEKKDKASAK